MLPGDMAKWEYTRLFSGLDGFTVVQANRDKQSDKSKGGGLAVFVNSRWCNPGYITVKERIRFPDIELF